MGCARDFDSYSSLNLNSTSFKVVPGPGTLRLPEDDSKPFPKVRLLGSLYPSVPLSQGQHTFLGRSYVQS